MKHLIYFLLIFLFVVFKNANSQNIVQLKSLAENAMSENNFNVAVELYKLTLTLEPDNVELQFMLAEAYRHSFNYIEAAKYYEKVFLTNSQIYPESALFAGIMQKNNENYIQAKIFFEKVKENSTKLSSEFLMFYDIENLISSCDSALYWRSNPENLRIENLHKINTQYNEFNPFPVGDSIMLFSSIRPRFETNNPLMSSNDFMSNIYVSKFGNLGLQKPVLFDKNINSRRFNTSNISISIDGKKAFFTRCENINNKLRCDIYYSENKRDKWTKPIKLSNVINSPKHTSTHPFICIDSISGNELLYFSSDREGGFGGMDLWFSVFKEGQPQAPINLGSIINSKGDEITPFYEKETGLLYFSSDYHIGMGGFDIFKSKGALSSWSVPKNLGYPYNTGANDFNYIIANEDEAYLTSNRKGSMTFKDLTCCNDIFLARREIVQQEIVSEIIVENFESNVKIDILELLPLSLYFDNDHPNPRSISSVTHLTYPQTLATYLERKQEFAKKYSEVFDEREKRNAEKKVLSFFENEVEDNFEKLEAITQLIYQDLLSGSEVSIKVRGFASPLTSAEYNLILTKRRIYSLINYFTQWNNEVLKTYLEPDSNNVVRFRIIEEAAGETLASQIVSDDPKDRRMSVYSPDASKERRIEIMYYESNRRAKSENIALIYIEDNLIHLTENQLNGEIIKIRIFNVGKDLLIINNVDLSSTEIKILSRSYRIEPGSYGLIEVKINASQNDKFFENVIIESNSLERRNVIFLKK